MADKERVSIWYVFGLCATVFLCFGVPSLFRYPNIRAWYATLIKPPLTPHSGMFTLVWIILFIFLARSIILVAKTRPSPCRYRGVRLFCVQLGLNILWAWIFLSRHQLGTATACIVVLWIATLLTILTFRKMSAWAAWLVVPYLVAVTFAAYFNLALWRLNP
jgi:translocator protein